MTVRFDQNSPYQQSEKVMISTSDLFKATLIQQSVSFLYNCFLLVIILSNVSILSFQKVMGYEEMQEKKTRRNDRAG